MNKKRILGIMTSIGLGSFSTLAGTATWDFMTDPTLGDNPLTLLGGGNGGGEWIGYDGADGWSDGFLSITGPTAGQWAKIIFPDMDNGKTIAAFTFECVLRIGNGTASPGDGFSINYARASDPTFTKSGDAYQAGGWSGTYNEQGSTGGSMAGLAEEGTITGLAIGFDAWQSNSEMWPLDLNAGLYDVVGISVRVDNKIVKQVALPTPNGTCEDATSAQTGPQGTADPSDWSVLCWAPFKVQLTEDKHLSIWWKNTALVDNLAVDFYPSAGRLVFGGRTGDAYQNTHIDDIVLTTIPADKALLGTASADAVSVSVTMEDAGESIVDQGTVTMSVNGVPATPLTFSKTGSTTTARWASPTYLASGADLTVDASFKDALGRTISGTRTAKVAAYARIPASNQVPTASVDTGKPGFLLRPYGTDAVQPNTLIWTEGQLLGLYGVNTADLAGAVGGLYTVESVANFNIDAPNGIGNFTSANGYTDELFPGFPGVSGHTGNASEEVLTYIEFPTAGLYQLGVNSDDGFRVTAGRAPGDLLGVILGYFDGGRGSSDTIFTVLVDPPGIYPIRVIWQNGSGDLADGNGANFEFFSVKDGVKTPINAPTADALKAYRESTAAGPWVSNVSPLRGATGVVPSATVMAEISNGSVQVNAASVKAKFNGVETPATVTPSGSKTTVTVQVPGGLLPSGAVATVTIDFSDSGTPAKAYSTEWQFTAMTYGVLSEHLRTAPGTGSNPGFRVKSYQKGGSIAIINTWRYMLTVANEALAGFYPDNIANLTDFTHDGFYWEPNVINYSGAGDAGNIIGDVAFPGIPGTDGLTGANAMEVLTYVEFPTAGLYTMGVNSDDGFRVTLGDRVGPDQAIVHVLKPESLAGDKVGCQTQNGVGDGGFGGPVPRPPLVGRGVLADPILAGTPLVNAAAIKGNIAICQRGTYAFNLKAQMCLDAGAIAVVMANNNGDQPGIFGTSGGGVATIPCITINQTDGDALIAAATTGADSPVILRIGDDASVTLGEFPTGRGASDTLFSFIVPQAGVYPFRLVWMNGSGDIAGGNGLSCEWFVQDAAGVKTLVNDPATPVKAWIARTLPATGASLQVAESAGVVTLSWTGVGELEEAYSIFGPWMKSANQGNPQTVPTSTLGIDKTFYRVRSY